MPGRKALPEIFLLAGCGLLLEAFGFFRLRAREHRLRHRYNTSSARLFMGCDQDMPSPRNAILHPSSLLLSIMLALTLVGVPIAFASISPGFDEGCHGCHPHESTSEEPSQGAPCMLVSCPCGLCAPIVMAGKTASIMTPHGQAPLPDSLLPSCLQGISLFVDRPPEAA